MTTKTQSFELNENALYLGVDGGGTRCRARLCDASGFVLGEGLAGPANIRFGVEESLSAVLDAARQCLRGAGLTAEAFSRTSACVALAGASEPQDLAAVRRFHYPFQRVMLTTDAHAACAGAHGGEDGGVVIIGTGSVGWAVIGGEHHRVGGWGFPVSDEGSGAWLGSEALRRVLWAFDGRIYFTPLLDDIFVQFKSNPHEIVRWMSRAKPRDFGKFAPFVTDHAAQHDPVAERLMRLAGGHIDALAARLVSFGTSRIALAGGMAAEIESWLSPDTKAALVPPMGDALGGALLLARVPAEWPVHHA